MERKNYVLVVEHLGETDILQLAYDIEWADIAVMLQVKYECSELPKYFYIDDEDDQITLDTEEAYKEALKVCYLNSDVLHVRMITNQSETSNNSQSDKSVLNQSQESTNIPSEGSIFNQPESLQFNQSGEPVSVQAKVGSTLNWASNVMKNTFGQINQRIRTISLQEQTISMSDFDVRDSDGSMISQHDSMTSQPTSITSQHYVLTTQEPAVTSQEHPVTSQPDNISSLQTSVKEPLGTSGGDISVPTSLEDECEVKLPIVPSSGENNKENAATSSGEIKEDISRDEEILKTIKDEVREAITQELSAFRSEIQTNIIQQLATKEKVQNKERTPKVIQKEIRELKKEIKETKKIKKERRNLTIAPTFTAQPCKQTRKFAASFICENLLDGSCVTISQNFVKYWVLKNEGTQQWDEQIQLELLKESPSADGSSVDPTSGESPLTPKLWGPESLRVAVPLVATGNTVVISINHVAPSYPCSYTSSWRLSRNGRFFGPRIWCNVTVLEERVAPFMTSQDDDMTSLSTNCDTDQSYIKEGSPWIRTRNLSHENYEGADDFTSLLSFEMTNIGDCQHQPNNIPNQHFSLKSQNNEPKVTENPSEVKADKTSLVQQQNVDQQQQQNVDQQQQDVDQQQQQNVDQQQQDVDQQAEEIEVLDDDHNNDHYDENDITPVLLDDTAENEVSDSAENEDDDPAQNGDAAEINGDSAESDVESADEQAEILEVQPEEERANLSEDDGNMSDFEVIPIPECFDTSRPLSGSLNEDGGSRPASGSFNHEGEGPSLPETKERSQSLPVSIIEDSQPEEVIQQNVEVDQQENQHPEKPQNTPTKYTLKIIPVPRSVLNMDDPISTPDYKEGYKMTPQKVVDPPKPLPRGVIDADKPWVSRKIQTKQIKAWDSRSSLNSVVNQSPNESLNPSTSTPLVARQHDSPLGSLQTTPQPPPNSDTDETSEDEGEYPVVTPCDQDNDDDEFILAPATRQPPNRPPPPQFKPNDPHNQIALNPTALYDPQSVQNQLQIPLSPTVAPQAPITYPPVDPNTDSDSGESLDPPSFAEATLNPSPMDQLVDMGFMDIDLNLDLLNEFSYDIPKVVNALVYRDNGQGVSRGRRRVQRSNRDGYFQA